MHARKKIPKNAVERAHADRIMRACGTKGPQGRGAPKVETMEAQKYLESVCAKIEADGHDCQPIREALAPYLSEADPFDVAEALYWYSYAWNGGQWSMEYALGCCTGYRPGASQRECEPDSVASMMLADLEALHTRPEGSR